MILSFPKKITNNADIIKTLTSYFARRVFNDITPPRLCVAVVPEKHQLGFLLNAQFSVQKPVAIRDEKKKIWSPILAVATSLKSGAVTV